MRLQRIAIDNIAPGSSTSRIALGGMREYLRQLSTTLPCLAPEHRFLFLTPAWADDLDVVFPPNVRVVRLKFVPKARAARILYCQTVLPVLLLVLRASVFVATSNVGPILAPCRIVVVVQFTQFYEWASAFGRVRSAYLRVAMPIACRRAWAVVTFTRDARESIVRRMGISPDKIVVIPHGISSAFRDGERHEVVSPDALAWSPYIIYVSSTYAYKNHRTLIRAFARLSRRLQARLTLVLVGGESQIPFQVLRDEAKQCGIEERVIFAGLRRPEITASLTRQALVAAFPSLGETFGFPVVEAFAVGTPVVASTAPSIAEVAGGAALLVNAEDEEQLASGLERAILDQDLRAMLRQRGLERSASFSWDLSMAAMARLLVDAPTRSPARTNPAQSDPDEA